MKSNGLLKWLLIPAVLLVIYVGVRVFSDSKRTAVPGASAPGSQLTAAESKALGIAGDTPRDTVATLVGQVKELRGQVNAAVKENNEHKAENERLRQSERTIDQRIQGAISAERDRFKKEHEDAANERRQNQSLLDDLKRKLDSTKPSMHADLPVGLGLRDEDAEREGSKPVQWVEPLDVPAAPRKAGSQGRSTPKSDTRLLSSFQPAVDQTQHTVDAVSDAFGDTSLKRIHLATTEPVYTVPANATLIGSTAMTALIGRVPIDGTVHDAYSFKVLIGADNLSANGIELPELAGAVVSGTASGDWTLSCVRGQVRSITFVFDDGTVRTVSSGSSSTKSDPRSTEGGLGWISDPDGVPCVSGERRSNAAQYLGSQALITAAGAGAASMIKPTNGNASFASGNNGNVVGTVGISGNEAIGRILGGGIQDMSQWVDKLYGQAFAAVYVRPGASVAVHIEQPLAIDYEPRGRKVNHRKGDSDHVGEMD